MYNFIFYVIYHQQLEKAKSPAFSRYNGCLIVAFALIIHTMFLYSLVKKIFIDWYERNIGTLNEGLIIILVVIFTIIPFLYYDNKRIEKILESYPEEENPTSGSNYFKVILIIFLPLLVGIILSTQK